MHAGATSREGSDQSWVVACRAIAGAALVLAFSRPIGRRGVALSPVVKLRGPVANL